MRRLRRRAQRHLARLRAGRAQKKARHRGGPAGRRLARAAIDAAASYHASASDGPAQADFDDGAAVARSVRQGAATTEAMARGPRLPQCRTAGSGLVRGVRARGRGAFRVRRSSAACWPALPLEACCPAPAAPLRRIEGSWREGPRARGGLRREAGRYAAAPAWSTAEVAAASNGWRGQDASRTASTARRRRCSTRWTPSRDGGRTSGRTARWRWRRWR